MSPVLGSTNHTVLICALLPMASIRRTLREVGIHGMELRLKGRGVLKVKQRAVMVLLNHSCIRPARRSMIKRRDSKNAVNSVDHAAPGSTT